MGSLVDCGALWSYVGFLAHWKWRVVIRNREGAPPCSWLIRQVGAQTQLVAAKHVRLPGLAPSPAALCPDSRLPSASSTQTAGCGIPVPVCEGVLLPIHCHPTAGVASDVQLRALRLHCRGPPTRDRWRSVSLGPTEVGFPT
jgi:hypothetical protein